MNIKVGQNIKCSYVSNLPILIAQDFNNNQFYTIEDVDESNTTFKVFINGYWFNVHQLYLVFEDPIKTKLNILLNSLI